MNLILEMMNIGALPEEITFQKFPDILEKLKKDHQWQVDNWDENEWMRDFPPERMPKPRATCLHCKRPDQIIACRGICYTCWRKTGVVSQYPPGKRGRKLKP